MDAKLKVKNEARPLIDTKGCILSNSSWALNKLPLERLKLICCCLPICYYSHSLCCKLLKVQLNSFGDFGMVFTCRKRQQNRRIINKLDGVAASFMMGQYNKDTQIKRRPSTLFGNVGSNSTNLSIPINGSEVDMQSIERSITDRVCCEVDNMVVTVDTRVHDAILASMDCLIISRVDLAMKSVDVSS